MEAAAAGWLDLPVGKLPQRINSDGYSALAAGGGRPWGKAGFWGKFWSHSGVMLGLLLELVSCRIIEIAAA